jgi:peptidoglycan/LPS O-acetylase OafA/YrhL
MTKSYRADIDGLRGIAILSVVGYHYFSRYVHGGFVGVDVFFVISGYLISQILLTELADGSFRFLGFYSRRIRRIFPALILLFAAALVIGYCILLPDDLTKIGEHISAASIFSLNFVLKNEAGYFDQATELKPLMHLWSLSIEEQFYFLFPLFLYLCWRSKLKILPLLVLITASSFALCLFYSYSDAGAANAFFSPHTRFWEISIGAVLACYESDGNRFEFSPITRNILSSLGLMLILASVFWLDRSRAYPGFWALMPTLGAAVLIAVPENSLRKLFLGNRVLVGVGLISYPLYLWHWFVYSFGRIIANDELPEFELDIALAISFLLAFVTYRQWESLFRFGANKKLKTVSLVAGSAALLGVASSAALNSGWPERFPEQAVRLFKLSYLNYDFKSDARFNICWTSGDSFAKECEDADQTALGRIAIWGDSNGARFYPGLSRYVGRSKIAQFTINGCFPARGSDDGPCGRARANALRAIAANKYDSVFLVAAWDQYSGAMTARIPVEAQVLEAVERLKAAGVKKVIVLGPPVEWLTDLPRLEYSLWKEQGFESPPPRMINGHTKDVELLDKKLRQALEGSGATYISMIGLLCAQDGCLSLADSGAESIMSYDSNHLTRAGSYYLAKKIFEQL